MIAFLAPKDEDVQQESIFLSGFRVLTFWGYFSTEKSRELVECGLFPPSFSPPCGLFLFCFSWFPVSFEFYMCMSWDTQGSALGRAISEFIN